MRKRGGVEGAVAPLRATITRPQATKAGRNPRFCISMEKKVRLSPHGFSMLMRPMGKRIIQYIICTVVVLLLLMASAVKVK